MTKLVQVPKEKLRAKRATVETRKDKARLIAYCRVSTDMQERDGVSIETQVARCGDYARLYEHEIVQVVRETGSAKSLDRPLLQKAFKDLASGAADGLLIVKLDRLTRSVQDIGKLVDADGILGPKGARLISIEEQLDATSATGRMMIGLIALMSQWEREMIGERTKVTMQHMKATGKYTGGHAPFGMKLDGDKLVPNKKESAVVQRARALYEKCENLHEVSRLLAAEGHVSRAGTPFDATQIRRMCLE